MTGTRIMRSLALSSAIAVLLIAGSAAQERKDPRVGLKPGLRDAGVAARNLELVTNVPKPAGFFDPKMPAGEAESPEREPSRLGPDPDAGAVALQKEQAADQQKQEADRRAQRQNPGPRGFDFANSDLAFSGNHMWMGNYHGFNAYNIENARRPRLMSSVVCPGGQGDVSVYRNLLFMSVEQTRGRVDCGVQGVEAAVSTERFRGIRIFDITDLRKPKQVAAIQTCRGSHTHTLVTDPDDQGNIYVYGSGTSSVRSPSELAECSALQPNDDPNTALFSIDVIQVPLAAPEKSKVVNRPRIFADPKTGAIAGLWAGGAHGTGTQTTSVTNQCHDITVFPEIGLAAGACSGNGILLDISDARNPKRIDDASDKNFAYWHSATFNNDGTKVIFTDEWGGGGRPRCRATDLPNWGADAIFDIVDRKLVFRGYYKLPAAQSDQENCVAHNGSLIPVPGRDIMVQAWYQGGVSVFDFTDSAKPVEIAYFDRGPISGTQLITGGYWSAYWYNGFIYGAEITRGMDVFRLTPSEVLTQNEIDAAIQVRADRFNAQQQPRVRWPATTVVARAYLDQLNRSNSLAPERAAAVKSTLEKLDGVRSSKDTGAAAVLSEAEALAGRLTADAGASSGHDASRMRSLAETIRERVQRLR
jgi:hypothetical protein